MAKLSKLMFLDIQNTKVTREGLAALMKTIPTCEVVHSITGLPAKLSDSDLLDD